MFKLIQTVVDILAFLLKGPNNEKLHCSMVMRYVWFLASYIPVLLFVKALIVSDPMVVRILRGRGEGPPISLSQGTFITELSDLRPQWQASGSASPPTRRQSGLLILKQSMEGAYCSACGASG